MKRGIIVDIPNEYDNLLWKVLKPIDITLFDWRVENEESYFRLPDGLGSELFSEDNKVMSGLELKKLIKDNIYYLIFADLKAYPKGEVLEEIETYEEFTESKCEVVVLVADGDYIHIYAKDQKAIELMYENALNQGFYVEYVTDENDGRTRLSV
ncbi:DUF2691 domain-containing protein [Bacillus toyonensis]|uniref:DUF2691 domain-containing protein n=1 Tax=Bacillus toyonensis TaxID=155322 RepID=A0A855D4I6_9BACI|nr:MULTISPECIES: DUF2691 family protein [Bacillus cereus group]PKR93307.1 hypothetical protein bcere0024_040990 [Bacillus cereus Rock4-18]MBJ7929070.1 DUF2691 family protein [Bacillus cereus group sp. N31]NSL67802.1 DUF2691 family protein [Bacillus toyonensis]PEC09721.1 DUF2691 domain-containing protein [Bacillus toyonensis]PED89778.1 DUF2691 domain-containing protein [Bacillus toyonensis]